MGLKIKKFQDIFKGMSRWVASRSDKLTDFSIGSATRTILEAVATAVEQAYFNMYKNVMWAIENSIYQAFGFSKIPAISSFGAVTLKFSYPTEVDSFLPKGARFAAFVQNSNKTLYFETREDYTIVAGSIEADVEVYCTEPGIIGNVAKGAITVMVNPIKGVYEVTNREAFMTGADEETTSSRKQRFNRYIETLARGTKKSIEYGAKEVEGVAGVWVDDSYVGIVRVYVHDSNGNLPESLKQKVIENLENYRSAGIPCEVLPISKIEIAINLEVTVLQAYNTAAYLEALRNSVSSFINGYPVAKSFYISDLVQYVMNYDDVTIINCKVITPIADVVIPQQEIIRSNSITVTLT